MTNRLDRLEEAGLVRRLPDPSYRRAVQVELTEAGRRAWDDTISVQAAKEALVAEALNAKGSGSSTTFSGAWCSSSSAARKRRP